VDTEVHINGVGLHGLSAPGDRLDLGNSGTSVRLMAGLLCGQKFAVTLTGDASLSQRPMRRILEPLTAMGASISATESDTLPLEIHPVATLEGIDYVLPVASAQIKSALLLAGLYARGSTCVHEPKSTRDHTERMLALFSHPVSRTGERICIEPASKLIATEVSVPGDLSSATFFIVGALIAPGSNILLSNVGLNPTRHAVIEILRMMGADIDLQNQRLVANEPVANIAVKASQLHGVAVPESLVPSAIDEFPAIMIAAANADGKTKITGATELRVKESDRISAMANGFKATGIAAVPATDGIEIIGGEMHGGEVDSLGDHRIAMAFAMAGINARSPIHIHDCDNVNTSFPGFVASASAAGLNIVEKTVHG